MSNVQSYQKYLSSEYPGYLSFIENIIKPIFGPKFVANTGLLQKASNTKLVDRFENIIRTSSDEQLKMEAQNNGLTSMIKLGSIELDNTEVPLLVYDIIISESKDLAKNRKGIQSLTRRMLEKNSGAFMIFHYADKQWEWRFSYCFKGMSDEESSNAKRFTYLLGPNQACKTAAQRFDKLRKQNGCIRLQDIEEAFNVEALSKEFFEKYKVRYGRFVGHIIGKEYVDKGDGKGEWHEMEGLTPSELFYGLHEEEKVVRDYVKKLLGRIVFLHFLQKKGWLGATDEEWTNGPQDFMHQLFENASPDQKENFLDDILEPLFSCLDTPLNQRREIFDTKVDGLRSVRIPFLGGLFERTEEDKALSIFPSALFSDLFKFLSEYNFTIDENDPNDAQVGVDPEMLGRIFENLLEDNKDKGAFYTPKEIVQYMCRESLITYLQTNVTDEPTREALRQFVTTHDVAVLGGCASALAQNVSKSLKDVKICDPAIGSGAFPMGLLNELFLCRGVIEDFSNAAGIKRHIIEQNIFGVDIEKGAVEIARLRFWLSLITDAEKPDVLPNMDFKIMQGNSLLEQYKGFDLSHIMDTKMEIHAGHQYQMFEEQIDVIRAEVKNDIKRYYNERNHDARRNIRDGIKAKIQQQMTVQGINVDISDIKDIAANDQFFLWHTWFSDVFEENEGFDIVIGNPPYIQLQADNGLLGKIYQGKGFETFNSMGDIYCLFYEHGVNLLRKNGTLCYITSNNWMRTNYGESLRAFFAKHNPLMLVNFVDLQIFDTATVETNILILQKAINEGKSQCAMLDSIKNLSEAVDSKSNISAFRDSSAWVVLKKEEATIRQKFVNSGKLLGDCDVNIVRGILTGYNDAFVVTTEIRNQILSRCATEEEKQKTETLIVPTLRGRDIKRYGSQWAGLWLINTHNGKRGSLAPIDIEEYPSVKAHLDEYWSKICKRGDKGVTPYNLRNCAYLDDLTAPKIAWIELSDTPKFTFTTEEIPLNTVFFMVGKDLKYLLGLLNSRAIYWYFTKMLGCTSGMGTNRWLKFTMVQLPIPQVDYAKQLPIITLVDRILSAKKLDPQADTSAEEQEIDQLVYKLYNLTPEEIAIVEGKN